MKVTIYQYPRGNNNGGILKTDTLPTISSSSFQNNVFLITYYEQHKIKNSDW